MIDMNDIMKKAQELSENMKQEQEELAKQTFTVSVGGEMVKMTFNGKQEAKSIEIDPEIVGPHCLVTVDLDQDGDLDIATCGKEPDGETVWYANDGSGSFVRREVGSNQGAYDIRAVDMDGDYDLDLLIAGHSSQNIVWFENPLP